MSSLPDVTTPAAALHDAAARLHTDVAARDVDLREALGHVGRALGELADLGATLGHDFDVAGPAVPSELVRRTHELVSSLCAARRNAELVCRHLPAARE